MTLHRNVSVLVCDGCGMWRTAVNKTTVWKLAYEAGWRTINVPPEWAQLDLCPACFQRDHPELWELEQTERARYAELRAVNEAFNASHQVRRRERQEQPAPKVFRPAEHPEVLVAWLDGTVGLRSFEVGKARSRHRTRLVPIN